MAEVHLLVVWPEDLCGLSQLGHLGTGKGSVGFTIFLEPRSSRGLCWPDIVEAPLQLRRWRFSGLLSCLFLLAAELSY